jgi:hypothetical protein
VIDTPTMRQEVDQAFLVAGWAADLDAAQGRIETLHAWAYPLTGGAPVSWAWPLLAVSGRTSPRYGDQFRDAGYGVVVMV